MTFDLWPWADLAQNLISSSTPHGAPLCQVWWKSTQGFFRYRVNEVKIFRLSSMTFDLWPWADLAQNLISSSTPHGAPLRQFWWKSTQGFLRYRVNEVKIVLIFRLSSMTFDLWPWADLAQNLISSSTPHGAPLCQVWWKSTQGFLRYCVNEVKIAYLDQVYWPLTFDLGRILPKI